MAVPIFHPKIYRRSLETATSNGPPRLHLTERGRIETIFNRDWVLLRERRVGLPLIQQKLPNVPAHVENAVFIRWIRADRCRGFDLASGKVSMIFIRRLIPPREQHILAAASSILPFGLRRQTLPDPLAVGDGGVPVDIHYRVIWPRERLIWSLPLLKIISVVKLGINASGLPFRVGRNEYSELRVGDQGLVDVEIIESDRVLGDLILK